MLRFNFMGCAFVVFFLLVLGYLDAKGQSPADAVRVNVKTLKLNKNGTDVALGRISVSVGTGTTTTDANGNGFVMIPPGQHVVRSSGPCVALNVSDNVLRRIGGTNSEPLYEFKSGQQSLVTFVFPSSCEPGTAETNPGGSGPCFTSDPGMVSLNPSMHRDWAAKQDLEQQHYGQVLMENLSRKVDLMGECKAVTHDDLSFLLAQVSYIPKPGSQFISDQKPTFEPYSLRKNVEWARQQSRYAVLEEIKKRMAYRILYGHERAGDAFVDMSLAIAGWYHEAVKRGASPTGQGRTANGSAAFFVKVGFTTEQADPRVTIRPHRYATEPIIVDYSNPNGSSRDLIIIVQPSKPGSGPHGSINNEYAWQVERPEQGVAMFPPLPEGGYEARYIGVDAGGNARTAAAVPFQAAKPVAGETSPAGVNTGPRPPGDGNPPPPAFGDLTGLWRNPGGNGVYRLRQVGQKVVWGLDAVSIGSFANVFQGQITGSMIDGVWEDLPGSPTIGGGRMLLKVESNCRFVRVSSVNSYGADIWVKQNSTCDIVGLAQKNTPSDRVVITDPLNKPATQNSTLTKPKPKPKVEEIPDDLVGDKPIGQSTNTGTNSSKPKPKVEEIPDNHTTASTTNKSTKPKVEEIPEDLIIVKDDEKIFVDDSSTTTTQSQAKPQSTPKPKSDGPSIWTKLGTAINKAATQQQTTQGQTTQGQTTQQPVNPDGTCTGGSFALGAPVNERIRADYSVLKFPWSVPSGDTGSMIHIFRAGTAQEITNAFLPSNPTNCGYSWPFNWDLNQFAGDFDAYLYDGNKRSVVGPVRFTVNK